MYLFHEGMHFQSYELFGSHVISKGNTEGTLFVVWAPKAVTVSVVGDFNNWNSCAHNMQNYGDSGVWYLFIPRVLAGSIYKYAISTWSGEVLLKADPYCFAAELRPKSASIVTELSGDDWQDDAWQENKKNCSSYSKQMLTYEVNLGIWRRKEGNVLLT